MNVSAIAPLAMLLAAALLVGLTVRIGSKQRGATKLNRNRSALPPSVKPPPTPIRRRFLLALIGIAIGMTSVPFVGPPAVGLAMVMAVMGWLLPRLRDERERVQDRAAALGQVHLAMALLRAQIAMGLGLESALRLLAYSPLIGGALAKRLRSVLAAYGLGRSVELALSQLGRELGSVEIEILARSISQARRLGVGLEETLARSEFEFIATHERRVTAAAERAQVRSQLLIVGCFLPAFMVMVLVPLFLGMLQGLGS